MEYVRNLIIVCAVGSVAAAFTPSRYGRGVRALAFLLVALTAVSPISGFFPHAGDVLGTVGETDKEAVDAPSYEDAVLEETAGLIASYVRDTLDEAYGVRDGVRISVLFDDGETGSPSLTEIQIFCGVRFDSYRDRKIEDELSLALGCDVFIFSE